MVKKETENVTAIRSPPNDSENHNAVNAPEIQVPQVKAFLMKMPQMKPLKGDIHSLVNKAAFTPLSPTGKSDTITKEKLNELKSFAKTPTWRNRNKP